MWVAAAIGVGSAVVGAGASIYGANKAADAQRAAANQAQQTTLGMYNQTRQDLSPYRQIGADAGNKLGARLDELTAPINLSQEWLESTPGYQFTKAQGLKAVQNSAAARGLGVSGAALKGAANFATGLADNTYKTQFDVANTNQTNAYNRLKALVDTGENAGAQTGALGEKAAYNAATAQTSAGNAQANAYNALGSAIGNVGNTASGYAMFKGIYGGGNNSGSAGNYGGNPENNSLLNPSTYGNV